jgi:hypothetical protein
VRLVLALIEPDRRRAGAVAPAKKEAPQVDQPTRLFSAN